MIINRRFIHLSSTNLRQTKHAFELLDKLAEKASSHSSETVNDFFIRSKTKYESTDTLNSVLARWKDDFLQSPHKSLNPEKVLTKVDEWKGLVNNIGVKDSRELYSKQSIEEILRPDINSYMHIIQAVTASIEEHSHHRKQENKNKVYFVDALLKRLIIECKTDSSIQPNALSFSTVMNAWAKTNIVTDEGRKKISSSSKKVEELLQSMEKLHEEGLPNVQPNIISYNILLNAWAKEGEVRKIEDTIQRMIHLEIPGVSPDSISYSTLLTAYARLGTPEAALKADSLVHQMLQLHNHGIESAKPNVISFNTVIQCYAELGNCTKAEEWLQRLQDLYYNHKDPDWKPDLAIYNTILRSWVVSGQPEKAENFLRQMILNDDTSTNKKDFKCDLDHFIKPNSRTFNIVLSAWAKIGEAERAEAILMEMHKLYIEDNFDTRPTIVSYNTVLDSYAQKTKKITDTYMKKRKGRMKNRSCNMKDCSTAYGKKDAPWHRAIAILNHMMYLRKKGDETLTPTSKTWNTVINVCAKAGRISLAEKILERFVAFSAYLKTELIDTKEDMTPSVRTWNILLSSCMIQGDVHRVKQFWLRMEKNNIQPDIVSYNTVLKCYAQSSTARKVKNFDIQEAVEDLFRRLWHDPNAIPNRITYLAIVNIWINQGLTKRAELFLLDMTSASLQSTHHTIANDHNKDIPTPSRGLFHTVLTSWGQHKAPKNAEKLLLKMAELSDDHDLDVRPNTETYNRLLNCWAKSMKVESGERAEVILREMEGLGNLGDDDAIPDIYSYNSVLNAWSNSGDAAALTRIDNLILEMILKGNPKLLPDSFTYGTWLKAIALFDPTDKKRRVEEVVKMMKIHSFKPNEYIREKIRSLMS